MTLSFLFLFSCPINYLTRLVQTVNPNHTYIISDGSTKESTDLTAHNKSLVRNVSTKISSKVQEKKNIIVVIS